MSDQQAGARRYEQAKRILQEAIDLPPSQRNAYLDSACGSDAELRAEVVSLLNAYASVGTHFLNSPLILADDGLDAEDDDPDLTGQRIGAYRLGRRIGRGGMGAVYLASRDDGEFVMHAAVKVIRPSVVTPALLKRFKAERQILAGIDHPNIARLIDGGTTDDGMPFFVMEYVQGETLREVLRRGPLPLPQAIRLATVVAEVLESVHGKGLVFRDIKPANIMLTAESGVKLLDFGIAKLIPGDDHDQAPPLTEPGWIVGSPPYMSPEQASGDRVDARSDVFSYGVVMFEALTGHLPFTGETREGYFKNLMSAEPAPLPAAVPAPLRAVVERCLKKSRADRFGSGRELAEAVRAAVAPPRTRNVAWWIAGAAAALALVVWLATRQGPAGSDSTPLLTGPPQPVATWASAETNPKISPDRRWASFISDRDGISRIWLIDRASGGEQSITPSGGRVTHHEWAPTSDRIAYVAPLDPKATSLIIVPIAGGESRVFTLPFDARLVRWIGDHIYYLAGASLWRFDVAKTRSLEMTTGRGALRLRGVDVAADERHIIFTALKDTVSSLWYSGLDGSDAVRLTEDRIDPRSPRWKSADAREVVYVSEEGGMVDIWTLEVSSRARRRLTFSDTREGLIAVSNDGSVLLYEQIRDEAHLATLDPSVANQAPQRITWDSLGDLLPSAAGGAIAFQRAKSKDMAFGIYNATVRLSRNGGAVELLGEGYAPEISPDGRWVAYLSWSPQPGPDGLMAMAKLWMVGVEEANRNPRLVTDSTFRFEHELVPLARKGANFAWSSAGPRLYFLARRGPAKTAEIWSATPGDGAQAITLAQITNIADDSAAFSDLRVSTDGGRLSYLLKSPRRAVTELRVVDLTRNEDEVYFTEKPAFELESPGWTEDGSIVVLRSDAAREFSDVLRIGPDRRLSDPDRLRGINVGVALDPRGRTLYFTRTEATINSLHALAFTPAGAGKTRLVFRGEPHGPAFSGIRVRQDGQLLFSVQAHNTDIVSSDIRKNRE